MYNRISNACIDDYFSDGILGHVFRQCPSNSYETLRAVSNRWDQVVDRYVGRVLIIKSGNTFVVDPESNLDRMSIRANYWMTLSSAEESTTTGESISSGKKADDIDDEYGNNVEEVMEKLQDISHPESVRKIGFVGQLGLSGYKPLECILNPCKNITSLYLHLSIFSVVTPLGNKTEPWQLSRIIPHLKELVIDSCGISCEDSNDQFEYKPTFLTAAAFLCSQKFLGLEKLIFRMPYMESVEGIIVRSLCIFLGRHAETIKSFAFTQKYELQDNKSEEENCESGGGNENETGEHQGDGDSFVEKDRADASTYFSTKINYLSLTQLGLSAMELKNVCLEELYVDLACKQESAPIWKNMLIKQNNLKKCIFGGDKIPIPAGTIKANYLTLVTLRLDIRDGVNLECFQNSVNLKHLSLAGRMEADDDCQEEEAEEDVSFVDAATQINLKNAKYLPVGLESLEIINLKIHKEDVSIMALHLRSLRDLILKNIGWEGNLGLELSDLAKVWKLGRLEHVCIKQSLNLMSFSQLEDNCSSPELSLLACVIQSNSYAAASKFFLEVWKNERGLYSTRKPDCIAQFDEEELDVFQMPTKIELCEEEEEEEEESSSDSEEEDGDGTGGGGDNDDGTDYSEKEAKSDDEWQECEDDKELDDDEEED